MFHYQGFFFGNSEPEKDGNISRRATTIRNLNENSWRTVGQIPRCSTVYQKGGKGDLSCSLKALFIKDIGMERVLHVYV